MPQVAVVFRWTDYNLQKCVSAWLQPRLSLRQFQVSLCQALTDFFPRVLLAPMMFVLISFTSVWSVLLE